MIHSTTLIPFTPPTYKEEGFNCPLCNYFSHQIWYTVYYHGNLSTKKEKIAKMDLSLCLKCNEYLLWFDGKVIFPVINGGPPPHPDMPETVKEIYNEANSIVDKSSRASAALLRVGLEILIDGIIGKNKNPLTHNIGILIEEKKLSIEIQQAMDYLRLIGDHHLHPGIIEMDDKVINDYEHTITLFKLLNLVVDELISRPKRMKEFFDSNIPQKQKDSIKQRDNKIKDNKKLQTNNNK